MAIDPAAIDDPGVLSEVRDAFARYERALIAADHDELDRWFWDDPRVVRFGANELLYGAQAIAAWRRHMPPVGDDRTLRNTVITTFGPDHAVVATEFFRPDTGVLGRQSQTWARLADGWRIIHAHVSTVDDSGVERAGTPPSL